MKTAVRNGLEGTLLFHLNLNYSSIEVASRRAVLERCYRPLLELVERHDWLRVALECPGHTLERIARLDPRWIPRLCELVAAGRVEFVGSGDSQLIGPLVPAAVNRWNQALGRAAYERFLGQAPRIALVNEMAWSQGLVDAYLDAGYEAVITEWNNPRRFRPEWREEWRYGTASTASPTGRRIGLLWADAVLFQRFQRAVCGDLEPEDYVAGVLEKRGAAARHLFLYASDAEVFDYRPGRYASERPPLGASEWERMGALLAALREGGVAFTLPGRVLDDERFASGACVDLCDAANPIPVKKQPKYNVTRWALSGWDDVGLNARCFARARELEQGDATARDWQHLCRAWGSDLRTHLTPRRWERLTRALPRATARVRTSPILGEHPLRKAEARRVGQRLRIETDGLSASLLVRRGLALESLAWHAIGERPLLGTLQLGHFEPIEYSADFYSGHTVLEVPAERRVTDLEPVEPVVDVTPAGVRVRAEVATALGPLPKELLFGAEQVELAWAFSRWGERPLASLRTGYVTLRDEAWGAELHVTCANGGPRERLRLHPGCDHGRNVSTLVSAAAALGATDGWLALDDGRIGIELSWPHDEVAALPLLTFQQVGAKRFVRLAFSLSEVDETHRRGAPLYDFRVSLRPYKKRR